MSHKLIILGSTLIALASFSLWAAQKHNEHTPEMNHNAMSTHAALPVEGGQATFSALIEIVAMLEQDEKTDWNTVDIDGLRAHLLDMHYLITDTTATKSLLGDNQIRFDIRGTKTSTASIHTMVPMHAKVIEDSRGWTITPALNDEGATLTITVKNKASLNRLNALGFYGFMSLDSHHQLHHYQMAVGNSH